MKLRRRKKREQEREQPPPSLICSTHRLQMFNTEAIKDHFRTIEGCRELFPNDTFHRYHEDCVLEDFDRWFAKESAKVIAAHPYDDPWQTVGP
jgi:hypothetical protein